MSTTTTRRTRSTKAAAPKTDEPTREEYAAHDGVTIAADAAPKGYLQTKAPSDLHIDLAAYIEEQTGLVVSPKAVQAVLGLHPEYQRSDRNKARQAYRPRIKDAAPVALPQPEVKAEPKPTRKPRTAQPKAQPEPTPTAAPKRTRRAAAAK